MSQSTDQPMDQTNDAPSKQSVDQSNGLPAMNVFHVVREHRAFSNYNQSFRMTTHRSGRLFTEIPHENQFRMIDILPELEEQSIDDSLHPSVNQINQLIDRTSPRLIDPRDVILLAFSSDGKMVISYTKPVKLPREDSDESSDESSDQSTNQVINHCLICIQFWSFYPGEKLSLLMEVPLVCAADPSIDLHQFDDELDDDIIALNGWSIQGIESPDKSCFMITCCSQSISCTLNQPATYHLALIPSPVNQSINPSLNQTIKVARRTCVISRSINVSSDEAVNGNWSVAIDRVRPKVTIASQSNRSINQSNNQTISHQLVTITSSDKIYCAEFCISNEKNPSDQSNDQPDNQSNNQSTNQPLVPPSNAQSINQMLSQASGASIFRLSDDTSIIENDDWLCSPDVLEVKVRPVIHVQQNNQSINQSNNQSTSITAIIMNQWVIDAERAVLEPVIVTHRENKSNNQSANQSINPCCLLQDFDVAMLATIDEIIQSNNQSTNQSIDQSIDQPTQTLSWHRFAVAVLKLDVDESSADQSINQSINPSVTKPYRTRAVVLHFDLSNRRCSWAPVENDQINHATAEVLKIMKKQSDLDRSIWLFLECTNYKICLEKEALQHPAIDKPNHRFDNRPVSENESIRQLIHPVLPYAVVL